MSAANPHPSRYLTTAQAAARLGVRSATVTRWRRDGVLPAVDKLPGRTGALLFDPDAVERLAAQRGGDGPEAVAARSWTCPTCRVSVLGTYDNLAAHRRTAHGWTP